MAEEQWQYYRRGGAVAAQNGSKGKWKGAAYTVLAGLSLAASLVVMPSRKKRMGRQAQSWQLHLQKENILKLQVLGA